VNGLNLAGQTRTKGGKKRDLAPTQASKLGLHPVGRLRAHQKTSTKEGKTTV